jgi:hypothetical protein
MPSTMPIGKSVWDLMIWIRVGRREPLPYRFRVAIDKQVQVGQVMRRQLIPGVRFDLHTYREAAHRLPSHRAASLQALRGELVWCVPEGEDTTMLVTPHDVDVDLTTVGVGVDESRRLLFGA